MRARDLPPPGQRRISPLPIALGALVVLMAVRLADVVGPLLPDTGDTPAAPPAELAADIGARLETITPAAGDVPTAAAEPVSDAAADVLTARLDDLVHPAAGPLDLQGNPLAPEPFLEERRELARQQEALAVRQVALEVAESRLREHVERLEALKAELEQMVDELSEEEEARLQGLVQLYERMKPREAAAIFDTLEFEVLVPLALRMREMKLAPILGKMETDVARELTAEIANRRDALRVESAQAMLR
ncbi:MAG: MotE family protein [Pseudomonadota bacterium]